MDLKAHTAFKQVCIFFVLISISILPSLAATPCELTLAYKEVGKYGYMKPAPDNQGLYQAIYTEVAQKMGCTLSIHRYPKKRTLLLLKSGAIDLYPSTGFDSKRSDYLFYISNGLYRYEPYYGLTPSDVSDLDSISGVNDAGLIWIFEAGRTTVKQAKNLAVNYEEVSRLTDARAIEMLRIGRRVFYRIIVEDYQRYLRRIKHDDLSHLNIKTHTACCEPKSQPLYVGISRSSRIIKEEANPDYHSDRPTSPENFPTRLVAGSVAYELAKTLTRMQQSGRINQLFNHYIVSEK